MDPLTILALVNTAVKLIPPAIKLGHDIYDLVNGVAKVTEKGATQADIDALRAISDSYSARIQATPIPDEDPN